jgi:choline dehydrogenase-like flavoprotein
MIHRIHELEGKEIPTADVCVVGTGAAGIEIASQLARASLAVTVLEAGLDDFDFESQVLCRFESVGRAIRAPSYSEPFGLEAASTSQCRLRQYGGTTNIWSGRWKVLSPYDLSPRPRVDHSGWPIRYDELASFYRAVADDYGLRDVLDWNEPSAAGPFEISDAPGLSRSVHAIDDAPLNMRDKFDAELRRAPNIKVLLGANVVEILLEEGLGAVKSLRVRSLDGREWTARARAFVLACGTIENARVLLQSRSQVPRGVGNARDLVGRNLLDHPKGVLGHLCQHPSRRPPTESRAIRVSGRKYGLGVTLAAPLLAEANLPNHCVQVKATSEAGKYLVKIYMDQLPNRDSRVSLSAERDALGAPVPRVDWRFCNEDRTAFAEFVATLSRLLAPFGSMHVEESRFTLDFLGDASHQLGTTPMGTCAAQGVVDSDCRVFDLDNLFMAGGSVFASAGNANPTFTILALARRLAGHLAFRYGSKRASQSGESAGGSETSPSAVAS